MNKKRPPINLTNREFSSIKADLVNYAKVYYPETYQDFNQASFGAMLIDMVAYVGDMLSFYTDYQTNETLLDSAVEAENIAKLAKQFGYKYPGASASTGKIAIYLEVPAQADAAGSEPDITNLPIVKKGTVLTSDSGASFTLIEDVDFSREDVLKTVGQDDGKKPLTYAYKAYGDVVSGIVQSQTTSILEQKKFTEIEIDDNNVIVMGYNTWTSLKKKLPNRCNVVISNRYTKNNETENERAVKILSLPTEEKTFVDDLRNEAVRDEYDSLCGEDI